MSDTPAIAPAGWYPAGVEGQERYWDGVQWMEMFRSVGGVGQTTPAVAAAADPDVEFIGPQAERPWYRRKAVTIPAGVLACIILISAIANAVG